MGLFDFLRRSKQPDLDELVLRQLRKAGSDLSKPHAIEFFLYFPEEAIAGQAAVQIREAGFEVESKRAATGNSWLCLASKTMLPDLATLQKIRRDFNNLSNSLGGEYDGWGSPVVD